MSAATAYQQSRFVRRTRLQQNEYNKNFRMVDEEALAAVTSPEADSVTPLMSKIYLRLLQAPDHCCRGERELHFEGEVREGKRTKAWDQLCGHLRVSSETAQKALAWMHKQGIIGYSAFKNRVGIFIFLNRAASSIGVRPVSCTEKILRFLPASENKRPASPSDTAFNDPFGDSDTSDTDLNPHRLKNGADEIKVGETSSEPTRTPFTNAQASATQNSNEPPDKDSSFSKAVSIDEIVKQLQIILEPPLKTAAIQASQREHARTREWLDKHGIPKATRVAQKETYNLLRSHGLMNASMQRTRAELDVGRSSGHYVSPDARPRTFEEITEMAEMCVALLEVQGKSIEVTLSEISSRDGGWLLPEDAPKVREAAQALLNTRSERI